MSNISISERENVTVTGVNEVVKVSEDEVQMHTANGDLTVKGSTLRADEFDPDSGILHITGRFDSLTYTTDKHHLPDNFVSRLFK